MCLNIKLDDDDDGDDDDVCVCVRACKAIVRLTRVLVFLFMYMPMHLGSFVYMATMHVDTPTRSHKTARSDPDTCPADTVPATHFSRDTGSRPCSCTRMDRLAACRLGSSNPGNKDNPRELSC